MSRNIRQQFNHAISEMTMEGQSKRAYKELHFGETGWHTFSIQTNENLRGTANQFAKFLAETHPELRRVRDITAEHVIEFLEAKAANWSTQTMENKLSNIRMIFKKCEMLYGRMHALNSVTPPMAGYGGIRDKAMEINDYLLICKSFIDRNTTSDAITAMQITYRTGARVREATKLRTSNINIVNGYVEFKEGTKGGKYRKVPIREKDKPFFVQLKAMGNDVYVCHGKQPESMDRAIRREMKRVGIADKYPGTTEHAIRKLYVKERMAEERAKGKSEREAWIIVQQELGHGSKYRHELYVRYALG